MKEFSLVGFGGALGACVRYALLLVIPATPIPWNVAIINLSGSFFIGLMMSLTVEYGFLSERWRLFWAVGVAGGYTTFSTFTVGLYQLMQAQAWALALSYLALNVVGGLLAVYLGVISIRLIFQVHRAQGQT